MDDLEINGMRSTTEDRLMSSVAAGPVEIQFLGTAAFAITTASGRKLLIDPYLEENEFSPLKVKDVGDFDLILVTHAAFDHLGDTMDIMREHPNITLLAGVDVRGLLMSQGIEENRIWSSPWGMAVDVAGVRVRPVYSRHWSYIQGPDGLSHSSIPLGYIIYASSTCRIYHSGDTALFSDLKLIGQLYRPTVALTNVGVPEHHRGAKHGVPEYLTGEMDSREAAIACQWLGVEVAIPCHHDSIELDEVQEFAALLKEVSGKGPRPELLDPGDAYVF